MIKQSALIFSLLCSSSSVFAQDCSVGLTTTSVDVVLDDMVYDKSSGWIIPRIDVNTKSEPATESFWLLGLINDAIVQRGGKLVIVHPPKRGMFIPDDVYNMAREVLTGTTKQDQLDAYNIRIEQLKQTGAIVPNLYSRFEDMENPYFQIDHHWRPATASLVAFDVWNALLDEGVLRFPSGEGGYEFGPQASASRSGTYAKAINAECPDLLPELVYTYTPTLKKTAENLDQAESLFGDAPVDDFKVTLLGTSFSAEISNFQFYGALSYFFQAPVENLSVAGGGIPASFEILQTLPEALDADLVVWEIAPNHFPKASEKFRDAAAEVLGGCSNDIEPHMMSVPQGQWSDWVATETQSTLVEFDTHEYFAGKLLVEASFGDRIESFNVEKVQQTPKEFRTSVWKTFMGSFGVDGEIIRPDKIRVQVVGSTQDHQVGVVHCPIRQ